MENNRFRNELWTCLFFDERFQVLKIENPDDRLFFGQKITTGKNLSELIGDNDWRIQAEKITDGLQRARREKRNVYLEYLSRNFYGQPVRVASHIQYRDDDTFRLYATAVDSGDLERTRRETGYTERETNTLEQFIYENLPIGFEIYDRNGKLMETNLQELKNMGVDDKKEVLGIDLFENPNFPETIKTRLRAGKDVSFSTDYDFDLADKQYYKTTRSSLRRFDITISVVRDNAGEINKYLLITQDITDRTQLQKKYDALHEQNRIILDSLPVSVGIYSNDGSLLYLNTAMSRTFGIDPKTILTNPLDINQNPTLPPDVKNAVRNGTVLHTRVPYDFDKVVRTGYLPFVRTGTRLFECLGQPIVDSSGKTGNYVFILNDVTESVRSEELLRQSKQKSELAMQAADIMLWEFDVRDRLFYSDNEPLNGYDRSKPLTVTNYTESIHPDDRWQAFGMIERLCTGDDFSFHFDARIQFPDTSEWQYCTVSGAPYEKNADGTVVKYVGSRKNNTELQRKKTLQENILNSIPLPIHIKDIEDNFRYVFCNEESKRMFGTSEEKTSYDVMDAEEVARIEKTDKEVFSTGKPYFGLERIVLKDGRSYDTIVRKSVIYDGDKRLMLNVRWDQSLQNELQRRAKVLSISMETMNAYTWFYEPAKDRISFGEGFDKLKKEASEVNTLDTFVDSIHPDDRQKFRDSICPLLEQESGEWAVEYRIDLNGDGTYDWWETRGVLETSTLNDAPYAYMLGMSINIQGYKQTELVLLKNKEDLNQLILQNELVLNNTNSGLAYITTDYIVQWENISSCSSSLSYEAYKKGERCYKSAHNRTAPCENCVLERAIRSRQLEQITFSLNNERTVEIFATPVFDNDNGNVDGVVVRVDDITDRERMIKELRQAKALAEQSDKLKSAFLANMSHEIRTPLNAIVGFSELLMTSSDEEERTEYARIISSNNELLLKLINDILDLSKIEAGSVELKYETFDLSEYFDGIAASMNRRIQTPDIRFQAVNPYSGCRVRLDKNRTAQILTNYVTNAIKYTPKGVIEMGYEQTGEGIRLYVRDSGIGIPDEKKDKVFHRFEKLDEFAQGTGLGLSICKAIAESMGGRVGFESRYGEGSLFWAILPCETEIKTDASEQPIDSPTPKTKTTSDMIPAIHPTADRKTILVAEDIPSNYLLVSMLLKKEYELIHAENGEQAVELARTCHADLLLMDMKMPIMDGMTATSEIRKFNATLPIVALTAHAFESDRLAALDAGCNDYLVKPINRAKLMEVVQKYCE